MSRQEKQRVVQQERVAHRQAVERLRQAYLKLYNQAGLEIKDRPITSEKIIPVQEKKE